MQSSLVEDFSHPGAAQILAEHGLKVFRGDGHIVFETSRTYDEGQCATGQIQVEKALDVEPYGVYYCFRTWGTEVCSGALVAPQWVVTARACLAKDGQVTDGAPAAPTTATVGRADLAGTSGVVFPVMAVTAHPQRNLALVRLATPVSGIAPVRVATTPPTVGESLNVLGYGRTAAEWVPSVLQAAPFTVDAVQAAAIGVHSTAGVLCRGDAGGPGLRTTPSGPEIVAITSTSNQAGCIGEPAGTHAATQTRLDDVAG